MDIDVMRATDKSIKQQRSELRNELDYLVHDLPDRGLHRLVNNATIDDIVAAIDGWDAERLARVIKGLAEYWQP